MSMCTKAFSAEPSPTRKCSRRLSRVRTATGSAMPLAIAAAWISSTRRCGVISPSILAEYSTITCGMASSRACDLTALLYSNMFLTQPVASRRPDPGPLHLKLASFSAGGRVSYGAVVGNGIVDLGRRLTYPSLLDALRAGALGELRKAAASAPDIALPAVALKRPILFPEKILCIGVNYANRNEEYKDGSEQAKYPSMFFRTPDSFVGSGEALMRPSVTQQFDYEGEIALVIGKEG